MSVTNGKVLGAALEGPLNRLVWLCEGLLQIHPDSKDHKQMHSMAKGARRLAMAGEFELSIVGLDGILEYISEDALESASLRKRVKAAKDPIIHKMRVESGSVRAVR